MPKISVNLACPKCGFPVSAAVETTNRKFLLFVCPNCHNNVVCYDNKLDIISDKMVKKLVKNKRLRMCGIIQGGNPPKLDGPITSDDVVNVKIALETSDNVDDFLKKI